MTSGLPPFPLPPVVHAGRLALSHGHAMHWEDIHPRGWTHTVLVLHGGPGSRLSPKLCQQALEAGPYRVVTYDQRGCGASKPRGRITNNTTTDLVADIERLRRHLDIDRWLVTGGSWGATLALAYAGQHPGAVSGLVLRDLFVPDADELAWFFQGAGDLFPAAWATWTRVAPPDRLGNLLPWLAEVFAGDDLLLQARVARIWRIWEQAIAGATAQTVASDADLALAIDRYKVQAHYLANGGWLGRDGLLAACTALGEVPTLFVHGSVDQVCRIEAARSIQRHLPGSAWLTIPGAGHEPFHPAMADAMARGLAAFAAHGNFGSIVSTG